MGGGIVAAIEASSGVKRKDVKAVMESLTGLVPGALKAAGKFTLPGITMIKLRKKPATKAGKRMAFGKEVFVKAKPARTIVKSFTVKARAEGPVLSWESLSASSWRCEGVPRCHDGACVPVRGVFPQSVRAFGGEEACSGMWGSPASCLSDGHLSKRLGHHQISV